MGIQDLTTAIKKYAKDAIKEVEVSTLSGTTMPIDTSIMLYQTVMAVRASGKDLTNEQGQMTSHLDGIFKKIVNMKELGIKPIFVFDGAPPDIKGATADTRRAKREKAKEAMKGMNENDPRYIAHFRASYRPTESDTIELKIMLDLLGIPYIQAPGEADVVCVWLTTHVDSNGKLFADMICSDDGDMLTFGGPKICRGMCKFIDASSKVTVINLKKILKSSKMTMSKFQNMCVLLGCDYSKRLSGPAQAYNETMRAANLKQAVSNITKKRLIYNKKVKRTGKGKKMFIPDRSFRRSMIKAKLYFKNAVSDLDRDDTFVLTKNNLEPRAILYEHMMDFMCTKHGFNKCHIKNNLDVLQKIYKKDGITRKNHAKMHKLSDKSSDLLIDNKNLYMESEESE